MSNPLQEITNKSSAADETTPVKVEKKAAKKKNPSYINMVIEAIKSYKNPKDGVSTHDILKVNCYLKQFTFFLNILI